VASTLIEDATISAIEDALNRLDAAAMEPGESTRRTRVNTHLAWVPPEWEEAARATLAGLQERHPSRTIVLFPDPDSHRDAIDAEVDVEVFADGGAPMGIASEVILLHLHGRRALAPASIVQPLLVADLPVFLRWRGTLPFGARELEQLLGVIDRLVVDSREWSNVQDDLRELPALFERVGVSDISWARTTPWRAAIAGLWPGIASAERLTVRSPLAEALLLHCWLRSRLRRELSLEHEPGPELDHVEVDGSVVSPTRAESRSPSDLLSEQLEFHGRDPIYEAAVAAL
jgi:glucose-6-phosphate dehydrogenase assembly protein OpcA